MTIIARIERKPKAWAITINVDNANTIAFDAVELGFRESGLRARMVAIAADGRHMVVTPDILLCSERLRGRMIIGETENDAQETVQKEQGNPKSG